MVITDPFAIFAQEFEKAIATKTTDNYPPHNIIEIDKDEWILQFAVAGFTKNDINISVHKKILTISGNKSEQVIPDNAKYIRKGIATRKFEKSFNLPDYTEVYGANVDNGILFVYLLRSVPEEQKPKTIEVK